MNVATLTNLVKFHLGYREFTKTGETPRRAYRALRNLYVTSHGKFVDRMSRRLSRENPPQPLEEDGSILGERFEDAASEAASALRKDGFYKFPCKLPAAYVSRLRKWAERTPCRALIQDKDNLDKAKFEYSETKQSYRDSTADTPKFNFEMSDTVANPDVQELLTDPAFVMLAQNYLECEPVLDLVAMWWSRPFHGKASSSAAQLYHFDMDRIRFLKIFFYLTDVTPETGPHCYVRGSHKSKPASLWRDGRISDEEMRAEYDEADRVEICGEAGTILAVDTVGFHKGKALTEGERLLLQFEFANSLFGANYAKPEVEAGSRLGKAARKYPRRYGMFELR